MAIDALLFDLDNTLYPAHSGVTEALEARMNAYVARVCNLSSADAVALRQHYFVTYGTTLRGLQLHHHVDVDDYLTEVHQFDVRPFVVPNTRLNAHLRRDTRQKAIFTNSPRAHAERILHAIALFDLQMPIIDIRAMQLIPKPHPDAYRIALATLQLDASQVAFFEDTLHNLEPAKALGMTTIYLSTTATSVTIPPFVDYFFPDIFTALQALPS
jgi:putative hydrolase of the HAD superfamily